MSPSRQLLYWLIAAGTFILLLNLLGDILLPFVAGMGVAYLLDPVADRLESWGLSRTLATSVVLATSFAVFILALFLILPLIETQLALLLKRMPAILDSLRGALDTVMAAVSDRATPEDVERIRAAFAQLSERLVSWLLGLARGVWSSGLALVNLIGLLVITPVVAWYLLRDWDHIVATIDSWLPREHAEEIRGRMREIDRTLAGFVRGQSTVCLILGIGYAVALTIVGLEFGLIVGLIAGAVSFIPYVGAIIGLVLSVGLAIAQFDQVSTIVLVAAIFVVGQAIEGNFLTPKLVGDRVGLHAVWVIFVLLAGGSLFGFTGVLVAVPVGATIGVLARYGLFRYLESPLYLGQGRPPDEP